jgi:ABC-2 type transport system ATP-binding protein
MIHIDNLSKRFGNVLAVNGITLHVPMGQVLGFLGPNGAGKSTTMKMITGFLTPTTGTVRICGHDILQAPIAAKRNLGYLPEGAPAYADMTPWSFLTFIAEIRGMRGAERDRAVAVAMDKTQIGPVRHQPVETLSKGFKRRVGLAQALLHNPSVLILDEPTDGLDPNQKHEVRKLLSSIGDTNAVVISTHILEEVDALCHRAVIMAGGRLLANATPDELHAMAPGHNSVSLVLPSAQAQSALAVLRARPDVAGVATSPAGEGTRITVTPRDRRSIVAPMTALVRDQGWSAVDIQVERGRLDDVFRAVTLGLPPTQTAA